MKSIRDGFQKAIKSLGRKKLVILLLFFYNKYKYNLT